MTVKINRRKLAKAATRTKVLEAGRALFYSVGYQATTIRDIAEDIGMSTGAIFANFKDKAALYREVYGHDPLTPEQGLRLAQALREAEAFMAGFEGSEQQDIDALLWQARNALTTIEPKADPVAVTAPAQLAEAA